MANVNPLKIDVMVKKTAMMVLMRVIVGNKQRLRACKRNSSVLRVESVLIIPKGVMVSRIAPIILMRITVKVRVLCKNGRFSLQSQ